MTPDADIVVVGAGGCGLMAALVASLQGASVLVLEKTDAHGGGTAHSHRGLRGAGTRFQRAEEIEDDPALYAAEIMARNRSEADPALVRALTTVSGRMIEFLADETDVDFELDSFSFGQAVPRSHTWHGSLPITDHLHHALEGRPTVQIRYATPSLSLLQAGDGAVTGVETASGPVHGGRVILASGGFGASESMLSTYIPRAATVPFPGHPGSTGDGIAQGMALGAAVAHMGAFQPYPAHVGPSKRGMPPGVIMSGGIVVDRAGRRFVDETRYPGGLAEAILGLPGQHAVEILDERIHRLHQDQSGPRSLAGMEADGRLVRADSSRELARLLDIDPDGLAATLAAHDAALPGTDALGRKLSKPLRPPLYGIAITVALYHTQGGLAVDRHGRVLRPDGSILPGLYAGGGAAVGISGSGLDGYLPGNGLLASLGLGMIAAEHAVASLSHHPTQRSRT